MTAVCLRWKESGVGFDSTKDLTSRVESLIPFWDIRGNATYILLLYQYGLIRDSDFANLQPLLDFKLNKQGRGNSLTSKERV